MAKKKIYKHHQRSTIAQALTDAQEREIVIGLTERQVGVKFSNGTKFALNTRYDIRAFGALADGSNDAAAIQAAVDLANTSGIGAVYVPAGTYTIATVINWHNGVPLVGDGKHTSIFKIGAGVELGYFILATGKSRWSISHMGFDNSANYPNPDTAVPNQGNYTGDSYTFPVNSGIFVTDGGDDWSVDNCRFYGTTGHGVRAALNSVAGYNRVSVTNCEFYNGSYAGKCISIAGKSDGTDNSVQVLIQGNKCYDSSVHKYLNLGIQLQNASTDAIEVDRCDNFVIANNLVERSAGCGVRCEASRHGVIKGNVLRETGQDAIHVYKECADVVVSGNTVANWGAIPYFGNLRKYPDVASTTYVIAREMPVSGVVNLPADPTASSWFDTNPYYLNGVSTSTIPVYDVANFYTSTDFRTATNGLIPNGATNQANFTSAHNQGILPFRGYSGICVSQQTEKIIVCHNRIVGNLTQTGGLYNYASDFGISTVHPINAPTAYDSPVVCYGNIISGTIQADIYQPSYCDPVNSRGAIDGVRTYPGNFRFNGSDVPEEIPCTYPDALSFASDVTIGGEVKLTSGSGLITPGTDDGSDTKSIQLSGGGGASHSRGAYMQMYGNEHATAPGKLKLVGGSITGGGDIEFWTNNLLRFTIARVSGLMTFGYDVIMSATLALTGHLFRSYATGITASTTQTQGQMPLTKDKNIVSTVANANDVVTLPVAEAGKECYIVNRGANTLQIFPASGDNINGAGVNTSVTLAAGASVTYHTGDSTNWYP